MSTITDRTRATDYGTDSYQGGGWILFASIMFVISATLNIIWGIAAVGNSRFFIGNTSYIISDLKTWGWVAIVLGCLEVFAALSIWRGSTFGRWLGIAIAGLAILAAMLSIPGYPLWSLTQVALAVLVIYGLAAYGGIDRR